MAEAIGSKELKEALAKISSDDLNEAAEGIAIAAGIEAESIAFYKNQARRSKGTEEEHFFRFLAGQEKDHLEAVSSLKEALEEKKQWLEPRLPENKKPEIFAKKDWDKGNREGLTAVLFALWREKQAREFYLEAAERIKNRDAKHFFKALAEFEKLHAEMLEEYAEESYYSRELIMG